MISQRNKKFKSTVFGEYLMDQFFFKVYTHQPKPAILDQRQIQHDHLFSILHEYLHYVHEVSTHIGTVCLNFAVTIRALLSRYVDSDLSSGGFNLNITLKDAEYLEAFKGTLNVIIGDTFNTISNRITTIEGYELVMRTISVPYIDEIQPVDFEVPEITFFDGDETQVLVFGKYFLYEGLAYELEEEFKKIHKLETKDTENGTEYTFMRYVAKHVVPGITTRTMLTLASLSLAYINCGGMFISMLNGLKIKLGKGGTEPQFLQSAKKRVSMDYRKKHELLEGVLEEIEKVYQYRSSLKFAFADLKQNYINAGLERIHDPSFEIDLLLDNDFNGLLTLVPPCDYMLVFNDRETFMRDFMGTSKFRTPGGEDIAVHHAIFVANAHYANALFYHLTGEVSELVPGDEEICCPYYSSCNLRYRKENPDICRSSPWLTYELAFNSDKKYCWYGSGVGFLKGPDIPEQA